MTRKSLHKTNVLTIFACRACFNAWLSSVRGRISFRFTRIKILCNSCMYYIIQWEKLIHISGCYANHCAEFLALPHAQTAVHAVTKLMHLMNHDYLIMGKTRRPPKLSPMLGLRWRSVWYLWCIKIQYGISVSRPKQGQKVSENPFSQRFSSTKLRESKWILAIISVYHTKLYDENP